MLVGESSTRPWSMPQCIATKRIGGMSWMNCPELPLPTSKIPVVSDDQSQARFAGLLRTDWFLCLIFFYHPRYPIRSNSEAVVVFFRQICQSKIVFYLPTVEYVFLMWSSAIATGLTKKPFCSGTFYPSMSTVGAILGSDHSDFQFKTLAKGFVMDGPFRHAWTILHVRTGAFPGSLLCFFSFILVPQKAVWAPLNTWHALETRYSSTPFDTRSGHTWIWVAENTHVSF